jgi:hypothetical protein
MSFDCARREDTPRSAQDGLSFLPQLYIILYLLDMPWDMARINIDPLVKGVLAFHFGMFDPVAEYFFRLAFQ